MSAFAQLLIEARDTLRRRYRKAVGLHFDWDGTDGTRSWSAWWDDGPVFFGSSGEESLRRLVEGLGGG